MTSSAIASVMMEIVSWLNSVASVCSRWALNVADRHPTGLPPKCLYRPPDNSYPEDPGDVAPGHVEQRTHDYVRHGTTTLFAALEVATGRVIGLCKNRHRHQEFLAFLRHVARAYPEQQLHVVMDNYAAHKRPEVKAWLKANPRIQVHFTPTSASWLNLVEVWFGIIERQAIRRGVFPSVRDLMIKIRAFIDGWNSRKHPFIWTKTPDDVLAKIKRQQTSLAHH